jgi:protein SCO1/2
MSTTQPPPAGPGKHASTHRYRWVVWAGAALAGVALAAGIVLATRPGSSASASSESYSVFKPGERLAPDFTLVDQHGKAFSLSSLRGRPVIVTFIDPFCRDFCPREASVLTEAAAQLGADAPPIVSVSVNPPADTPENFRADALHWRLTSDWRWGTGTPAALAEVWRRYAVGVQATSKTVAGVKVRQVTHTGAAYLIDRTGHERALFLYPFTTADVVGAARDVLSSSS